MLTFLEGVPGSGKSYDAVASHVLPAIKAGRKVQARINGLDHEKIAAHLEMSLEDVRDLLIHVEHDDVLKLYQNAQNDALIVVDEAHKYWCTNGSKPLHETQETFFAEHRHKGLDIVLMSQHYKRMHSAIKGRVERKVSYQKLTAVGMKNSYRATFYHSVAPDKFEKVTGTTYRYKKEIFPLYRSIVMDASNMEVYEAGGTTVWKKLGPIIVIAVVLFFFACKVMWGYFHPAPAASHISHVGASGEASAPAAKAGEKAAAVPSPASPLRDHPGVDTTGMRVEQAYLFEISAKARARLAAVGTVEGREPFGVIEWRDDQTHALERLTLDQIRAMGVKVEVLPYGVKLVVGDKAIIATSWPLDSPSTAPGSNEQPPAPSRSGSPAVESAPVASPALAQSAPAYHPGVGAASYTPPELTTVSALSTASRGR